MKRSPNPQQRQRLLDLVDKFDDVCLHIGFVIGVVGILAVMYLLGYPIWFLILFIPFALVGGLPFGTPIGFIAGIPFSLLFTFLIDWLYPEDKPVPAVKPNPQIVQETQWVSDDVARGVLICFGCLLAAIVIVTIGTW